MCVWSLLAADTGLVVIRVTHSLRVLFICTACIIYCVVMGHMYVNVYKHAMHAPRLNIPYPVYTDLATNTCRLVAGTCTTQTDVTCQFSISSLCPAVAVI
jgi:hypothetical protein